MLTQVYMLLRLFGRKAKVLKKGKRDGAAMTSS